MLRLIDVRGTVSPEDEEAMASYKRATAMPYQVNDFSHLYVNTCYIESFCLIVVCIMLTDVYADKVGQYNLLHGNNSTNPTHTRTVSPAPNTLPVVVTQPGHSHTSSDTTSDVPLPSEVPNDSLHSDRVKENKDSKIGAAV